VHRCFVRRSVLSLYPSLDMLKWMFLPLKRYAEFSGRSRRKEYWLWFLFTQGLSLLIMTPLIGGAIEVIATVMDAFPEELSEAELDALILDTFSPSVFFATIGVLSLLTLAFLVPNLAVNLRRFHDANIEGKWFWILLVASFVPFLFGVPALAIWIIAGFVPGTSGRNKFGDDPRSAPEATLATANDATRTWPAN